MSLKENRDSKSSPSNPSSGPTSSPFTLSGESRGRLRLHPSPSVYSSQLLLMSSDGHMTLPDLHAATLQPIKQILKMHQDGSRSPPVSSQHLQILSATNDVTPPTAVSGSEIMRPGKEKCFKTNAHKHM